MALDRLARIVPGTRDAGQGAAAPASNAASPSNSATQETLRDAGGLSSVEPGASPLSGRQVGVLSVFGISPQNLDDEAQARMAHALGQLDGLLAGSGGGGDILLEGADFTLSIKVSTDPTTGATTSRLLYGDADGTWISGVSDLPVETLFSPEPAPEHDGADAPPAPDTPGWLSALADLDAEYDLLARAGGLVQACGGVADLGLAVELALAPEPTLLTKAGAVYAGLRGLDDLQAGVRTAITGEPTETVTQGLATEAALVLGADPETAEKIGLAVDMAAGVINPAGRIKGMTATASERLAMESERQGAKHGDDGIRALRREEEAGAGAAKKLEGEAEPAFNAARRVPTPDEVRGTSPIPIPKEAAVVQQTKAAGYEQIRYTWDDGSARFEARWHTRTPGAPLDQGDTWVIERKTHGTPTGQQKAVHVLLADGRWVTKKSWQDAIAARQAGTATAEQEAMLAAGHHPAH